MKPLGIVILGGFFGLLCLLFLVYTFKIFLRCRAKLRLKAEFRKRDIEENHSENCDTSVKSKKIVTKSTSNNTSMTAVKKPCSDDTLADGDEQKQPRYKENKLYDVLAAYQNILKLPRVDLSHVEHEFVRIPEVLQVYSTDDIRKIQSSIWSHGKSNSYLAMRDLGCNIVIGTSVHERNIAGFFVNLEKKLCQQYKYNTDVLPWEESWGENQRELEMKNLLFALLLWQTDITDLKTFRCYSGTEDPSSCSVDNFYGRLVAALLEHLTHCENAVLADSNVLINRNESPKEFAQYIQPAQDLLLSKQDLTEKYIRKTYGIREFVSSHVLKTSKEDSTKVEYVPSSYFKFLLEIVNKRCHKWSDTFCHDCDFTLSIHADKLRDKWTSTC